MTRVYSIVRRPSAPAFRVRCRWARLVAVAILCLGGGRLWAQTGNAPAQLTAQGSTTPQVLPPSGPQILSVSAFAAYYSSSAPETAGSTLQVNSASLPAEVGGGGSIVFGWSKFTERTTFSMNYSPSYAAQTQYTSLNALNHAFSLNIARKLDPRWRLGFSVDANYSTITESLFTPTEASNVAAVSIDLRSAFGRFVIRELHRQSTIRSRAHQLTPTRIAFSQSALRTRCVHLDGTGHSLLLGFAPPLRHLFRRRRPNSICFPEPGNDAWHPADTQQHDNRRRRCDSILFALAAEPDRRNGDNQPDLVLL